jgi:protein-disulfide isomerase
VRIVFKHLPLANHSKAPAAHAAAEAAYRQDRFWEMHDKIFASQREMSPEKYREYAAEIGLDVEQFDRDIGSAEVKSRIDADKSEAERLGTTGTPHFFINGRSLRGAKPYETFKEIIDEELARKNSASLDRPAGRRVLASTRSPARRLLPPARWSAGSSRIARG